MIELILMPVGTIGPHGKSMKRSTLGARRSKVEVHESEDGFRFGGLVEALFFSLSFSRFSSTKLPWSLASNLQKEKVFL